MPQLQARKSISWEISVKRGSFTVFDAVRGVASTYLCLDDVPGVSQAYVIFRVVESQAVLQILLGILTHLEMTD